MLGAHRNYANQYRSTGVSAAVLEADPHRLVALMLSGARDGNHFFETGQHDVVEKAQYLCWRVADTNWRADLRAVAAIPGGKLHNDDITVIEHAG